MKKILIATFIFIFSFYYIKAQQQYYTEEHGKIILTQQGASHLASLPLKCLDKEFPFKPWYVISDTTFSSPKKLHPAFCGCFDWHSSVHGALAISSSSKAISSNARSRQYPAKTRKTFISKKY